MKNVFFSIGNLMSYQWEYWESGKSFAKLGFQRDNYHTSSIIYIYRRFCIATFDYVLEGKGELFIMHCELWFGSSCGDLARQDLCLCALLTRAVSLKLRKSCLSPKARIVNALAVFPSIIFSCILRSSNMASQKIR